MTTFPLRSIIPKRPSRSTIKARPSRKGDRGPVICGNDFLPLLIDGTHIKVRRMDDFPWNDRNAAAPSMMMVSCIAPAPAKIKGTPAPAREADTPVSAPAPANGNIVKDRAVTAPHPNTGQSTFIKRANIVIGLQFGVAGTRCVHKPAAIDNAHALAHVTDSLCLSNKKGGSVFLTYIQRS